MKSREKSSIHRTWGAQFGVNSPPAPCLDLTAISSAISLRNVVVRSQFWCGPDVSGSLLKGPSLVPELPNLVQKDPNLASKSFREIIDISAFDGLKTGRGIIKTGRPTLAARHWHCRGPVQPCWTSCQAWSSRVIDVVGWEGDVSS